MKIRQFGHQYLARTVAMTAFVATIALAAPTGVGATAEDAYNNSITQIQVCEAMGGEAEVTTYMTAGGEYQVFVECEGGYMDGFDCINDKDFTECTQTRLVFGDEVFTLLGVQDVKSLDEPVKTPAGGVVELPETIAPPVVEEVVVAEPTAAPEVDPVIDPVIDEPVVSDGEIAPEPTAEPGGDDGTIIVDGPIDVAPEIDKVAPETDGQIPVKEQLPVLEPVIDPIILT